MKKILNIALATTVSLLLLGGCGSENTQTAEGTSKNSSELVLKSHTTTKKVHHAIIQAGEENGLKMTEFKSNTIIAERMDGEDSASATIVFTNSNIRVIEESGSIDAEDLLEAIEKALSKDSH